MAVPGVAPPQRRSISQNMALVPTAITLSNSAAGHHTCGAALASSHCTAKDAGSRWPFQFCRINSEADAFHAVQMWM